MKKTYVISSALLIQVLKRRERDRQSALRDRYATIHYPDGRIEKPRKRGERDANHATHRIVNSKA